MELVDFPVDQLAAVLARAELTIANDSGIGHLSSAAGTPVLAIFGPTHAVLGFAPRGLHDRVIGVDEYCRPCSLHGKKPCFREERFCLTRISPEQVAREAAEILDSGVNRAPALFVDRDGTVMVDKGYLSDPEQVELLKGSAEALRLAKAGSYRIVIVTNQSGVARGYFGTREVERTNGRLLELLAAEGVDVDGIYYCPHHSTEGKVPEFSIECQCRKPSSGMAEQAALDLGVDLRRSIVIGDTPADYDLGRIIGGQSLLVRTGYGAMTEEQLKSTGQMSSGCVFDDLLQAVEHVIRTKDKSSCQGQR